MILDKQCASFFKNEVFGIKQNQKWIILPTQWIYLCLYLYEMEKVGPILQCYVKTKG